MKHHSVGGFALPNEKNAITKGSKCSDLAGVTPPVVGEFLPPELSIALRYRGAPTTGVVMPIAAVDENSPPFRFVGNVR